METKASDESLALHERCIASIEAVDRAQAEELAAMTEEEAIRRIKSLRLFTPVWREQPGWSGLVEQQSFFHRRRST